MTEHLVPLKVRGKATSVSKITDDWFVACLSKELKKKPLSVMINGTPLVLFRAKDRVGALLDRCPHRNVPLSMGRVQNGRLQCGYHGWEFESTGHCAHIPCLLDDEVDKAARRTPSFEVRELDGFIWVYGEPNCTPQREPFRFPHMDDSRYAHADTQMTLQGSVQQIAENALDVPHTAFLHGGIFRNPNKTNVISVEVLRDHHKCEAHYIGEPSPPGLLGKILAPGGGEISHVDRFLLPSITQVEYALGEGSHLVASSALTPIRDFETRLYGRVSIRTPLGFFTKVFAPIAKPVGLYVLGQDKVMLKKQAESVDVFGGEQMVSTDVDTLGPHILRLMKNAEAKARGKAEDEVYKKSLKMRV